MHAMIDNKYIYQGGNSANPSVILTFIFFDNSGILKCTYMCIEKTSKRQRHTEDNLQNSQMVLV